MSKCGAAAMQLAGLLLGLKPGARLPRVRDMAVTLSCGNGTVQGALALLEEAGAIETQSRGRLGTFLISARRDVLWEMSGMGHLAVAMPLPYSTRYEGLATGLREAFEALGVPFSLYFMRGSSNRVAQVVEGRVDLAVTSGLSFTNLAKQQPICAVVDLGPRTFVGAHGVVLASGLTLDNPHLRVAVDRNSADQTMMVEAVFGRRPGVEFVDMSYAQLAKGFAAGTIDATVWNLDELNQHVTVPLTAIPISEVPQAQPIPDSNTHAVLVGRLGSGRPPAAVLADINFDIVRRAIEDVIAGRRIPTY